MDDAGAAAQHRQTRRADSAYSVDSVAPHDFRRRNKSRADVTLPKSFRAGALTPPEKISPIAKLRGVRRSRNQTTTAIEKLKIIQDGRITRFAFKRFKKILS